MVSLSLDLPNVVSALDGITALGATATITASSPPVTQSDSGSENGGGIISSTLSVGTESGNFGSSTGSLWFTSSEGSSSGATSTLTGSGSNFSTITQGGTNATTLTVSSSIIIVTATGILQAGTPSGQNNSPGRPPTDKSASGPTATGSATSGGGSPTIKLPGASGKNRFPPGLIVAIAGAASVLILLVLALFLCRKRRRSRRDQAGWISQRPARRMGDDMTQRPRTFTISTNRSRSDSVNEEVGILSPSPVDESEGGTPSLVFDNSSLQERDHRISISSDASTDSQYFVSLPRDSVYSDSSPMSVHPFSPSETFAFPKPPHSEARPRPASHTPNSADKIPVASFRLTMVVVPPIPPLPISPPPIPAVPPISSVPTIATVPTIRVTDPFDEPAG